MGEAVLQSGYWFYQGTTVKCWNPSACPSYSLNLSSSSSSTVECGWGRRNTPENVLCSECLPGYSEWNESCIPCSTVNGGWVVLLILFAVLFWMVMAWNAQSSASLLGVYLYFIQIAVLMMGSTVPLVSVFHFVQFAPQSTIASFSVCPFPWTPWQQFSWQLWMPFLFLGFTASVMGLFYLWSVYHPAALPTKEIELTVAAAPPVTTQPAAWNTHPWIRIFVAIGLFMYTQLSETILLFYDCIPVGPFEVVARMPSLHCHSTEWNTYVGIISLLLITVVIGFPALISGFLIHHRHAIQTQQDSMFAGWANGLYSAFRPECWYYMIVVLVRRTCCSCFLFIHDSGDRALVFIIFHLAALCVHWRWCPFAESISNTCETISHLLLIWLAAMVSRYPDVSQAPHDFQVGMGICVLIPSLLFLGLYGYRWILKRYNQWQSKQLPSTVSAAV
jgi:hypothetical protein